MLRRRRRRVDAAAPPVVVEVDGDGTLAAGTIVDAAIVARLVRVPLLRLEGTVVLSPGRAADRSAGRAAPALAVEQVEGRVVAPREASDRAPTVAQARTTKPAGQIGAALPGVARRLAQLQQDRVRE